MSLDLPPTITAICMGLGSTRIRMPARFEGVTISEYAGIDTVARMGAFIAEHGALGAGLLGRVGFEHIR